MKLGGSIDHYLPEALELLAAHKRELELMYEELGKKWCQSAFSGRPKRGAYRDPLSHFIRARGI